MTEEQSEKRLTTADQISVFWRSNFEQGSWNYERMQNLGFAYVMVPVIKRLYETPAEQQAAMQRHLDFFNTMPYMQSTITGVVSNLETQRANGSDVDGPLIDSVKVGMMGPLAGVGDPIWWGTLRPVLAAFAAGLAQGEASLVGPVLFFTCWNVCRLLFRWKTQQFGYQHGVDFMTKIGNQLLPKVTLGASVLGMFVMGTVVPRWTTIYFPTVIAKVNMGKHLKVLTVQGVLDRILPGIAPLLLTLLCLWLLRKRVNAIWLLIGLFLLGILGAVTGVLGVR